jgi:hypothetical protein
VANFVTRYRPQQADDLTGFTEAAGEGPYLALGTGVEIRFLGKEIGPAAVPARVAARKDAEAEVRWSAAEALVSIGPAAEAAVPALLAALKDDGADVRRLEPLVENVRHHEDRLIEDCQAPRRTRQESPLRSVPLAGAPRRVLGSAREPMGSCEDLGRCAR